MNAYLDELSYSIDSDCIFGFAVVDYPYLCCARVVCRKLKLQRCSTGNGLAIGVSAPGIKPNIIGLTFVDSSSYCMSGDGTVYAAGQMIIERDDLPASSIIQPDLFKQRGKYDQAFTEGDEVVVTLDCSAHTLRLESPTVDHTISILQQHHNPQQQWVINVNFLGADFEVKLT